MNIKFSVFIFKIYLKKAEPKDHEKRVVPKNQKLLQFRLYWKCSPLT